MNRLAVALALALCTLALSGCAAIAPAPVTGDLTITLDTEPAQPMVGAPTTLMVSVLSGDQPLLGARVMVVRRMLGVIDPQDDIIAEGDEQGGGRYAAATAFAQSGRWNVQVIVTPPAGEARTSSFTVDIAPPK